MNQQGAYPPPNHSYAFGRASRVRWPEQPQKKNPGWVNRQTGNMVGQQTSLNQHTENQSSGGGPVQPGQFDTAVWETTHVQTEPGSKGVTQIGPQGKSSKDSPVFYTAFGRASRVMWPEQPRNTPPGWVNRHTGNMVEQQTSLNQPTDNQSTGGGPVQPGQFDTAVWETTHVQTEPGSHGVTQIGPQVKSSKDSPVFYTEPSTQQNTGNGTQQQQEQQHVRHRQDGSRERSGRDSTFRSPEPSTQQNTGNGTQQQQEQKHVRHRQGCSRERSGRDSTFRSPESRPQQSTGQHSQGEWSKQHHGNHGSPTGGQYQQSGHHNQGRGWNSSQDQYNQRRADEYYHGRGYDSNYRGNGDNNRGFDDNRRGQGRDHRGNEPFSPCSSDSSPGKQHWTDDDIVFLSKTLFYLLRHGATRQGYKMLAGGFFYVEEILQRTQTLYGFTVDDVQKVVSTNDKHRFAMKQDERGYWMIKANQGHTFEVKDFDLTPITSADQVEHVLHGTYKSSLELIKPTGISRMTRNHIHYAVGEPGNDEVISAESREMETLMTEQETSQQKIPPIELVSVVFQGAEGLPVSESHAVKLNKDSVAESREIETLMSVFECKMKLEALTEDSSSVLAVTYMGDKLGTKKCMLESVAVTGDKHEYVIVLDGDREIGQCLGNFLNNKNVIRAYNGIKELAEGLLQEYDILIDDGLHMDIKLMYKELRGQLSNDDKRKLEEVEGIPDEWSTEIKKMKLDGVKEQGETLVRHGKEILHYYKVLNRHQGCSEMKEAKKETYKCVRFGEKGHWLYEKYESLKPGKKQNKTSTKQSTTQKKEGNSKGGKTEKKKKNRK